MRILILIGLLFSFTIIGKSQTKKNEKNLLINIGPQISVSKIFSESITNKTVFTNFGLALEFYLRKDTNKISQRLIMEFNFSNRGYEETQSEFPFYREEINENSILYQTKYSESLLSYDLTQLFRLLNRNKVKLFAGIGGSLQFPISSSGMRRISYNDGTEIELDKLKAFYNIGIGGMLRLNYEINRFNFFTDLRGYFYIRSNHQRYGKVVFERDIDHNHKSLRMNLGISYRMQK